MKIAGGLRQKPIGAKTDGDSEIVPYFTADTVFDFLANQEKTPAQSRGAGKVENKLVNRPRDYLRSVV